MIERIAIWTVLFTSWISFAHASAIQYSYDSLNRLTRVAYADGTAIVYAYDDAGNRLSQVVTNPAIAVPAIATDRASLSFSVPAGQASAGSQTIAIRNAGGGALQWNASSSVGWLITSPESGTDIGLINVSVSAANLAAGAYTGSVVILASAANAPLAVPVTLTVTPSQGNPSVKNGGITSAAGYQPGVTRGSVATIFGDSLAASAAQAQSVPLPRILGNVQVSVDGINAPLWYVDSGQINFQIPFESPLQGTASIVVKRDGASSSPANVSLVPYSPSVFMYQRTADSLDPIIVHATTNQLVTPANPAVPGEYVVVYGTGIGDVTILPPTGDVSPSNPPSQARVLPTATIGGISAVVSYAGLTAQAIGLVQFNIQMPKPLPSGASLPLVMAFGQAASQSVLLYVAQTSSSPAGTITTVAGSGAAGFTGDNGPAMAAQLNGPFGTAVDGPGSIYIADSVNNRVRRVDTQGNISTLAGTGIAGYNGDGIAAATAQLNGPTAVATDAAGNVYVVETSARVRRIDQNGVITTVAGTGLAGSGGDGGLANLAQLNYPQGMCFDSGNNIYIVDTGNSRIRKISPGGVIATLAAGRSFVGTCAVDQAGNVLAAEQFNRIDRIDPAGNISLFIAAQTPRGLAVDSAGTVYYCDYNLGELFKIGTDGTGSLIAGTGTMGFGGDGGPAGQAQLNYPSSVAVDGSGNLYVSDYLNQRIRKIIH